MKMMAQRWYLWAALLIGTVEGLLYAYTMKLLPDQLQLLRKGVLLSAMGQWTHFGNAITGGGFNPGSLTSALVGVPLMIWDSPFSYEIAITALQLFGLFLLYKSLEDEFSEFERLAFVMFIWLTPWRASFAFLWNPSYLFFVSGLHLYTAVQIYRRTSFLMTFLHFISLSLALQIHASFIVLILATSYLVARRCFTVDWRAVGAAVAVGAASLIPYILATMTHQELSPMTTTQGEQHFYVGRGLVEVIPLLKGIFYWPRYASALFPNHIQNMVSFDGVANLNLRQTLKVAFFGGSYTVGILTMIISLAAFVWLIEKIWRSRRTQFLHERFMDNYMTAMVFAVLGASAISPIIFSNWHLLLIMPIANIQLFRFLFRKMQFVKPLAWLSPTRFVAACCVYFIGYNIVAVSISNSRSFTDNIHTHYSETRSNILQVEAAKQRQ